MKIKIPITMNEIEIGDVAFVVEDEENMVGHPLVHLKGHSNLDRILSRHLATNPNSIAVAGGHIFRNVGGYLDGVIAVLDDLSESFGFDYEAGDLFTVRPPDGAVF